MRTNLKCQKAGRAARRAHKNVCRDVLGFVYKNKQTIKQTSATNGRRQVVYYAITTHIRN